MAEPEPKVSRDDIMHASKGMLQKQLFVVFTRPTAGMGPVMANLEDHLAFQVELENRGVMLAAGPFFTDDMRCWEGEGMVIIRAASMEEADRIAVSDPMHRSGARTYTIRPWLMNEGSLTVKLRFSEGGGEIL